MKNIQRLVVKLSLEGIDYEVGELALNKNKIFFKYYPSFQDTGYQISPFKLPFSDKVLSPDTQIFDGLFGVFDDSLPDGWGRLLIDRALIEKGVSLSALTPLDRLSLVGDRGMGALSYHPATDQLTDTVEQIKLDLLAKEVQKVLSGTDTEILEELFSLGGSSGGARPKILVGYHPESGQLLPYQENLPDGYEHWIVKFPASSDPDDIAEIEYAYYLMAIDAGIAMSKCRLFEGQSGKKYFGTKRFDRIGNNRLHLHSASGMLHDNFRLSNMDYGHLMDAAFQLEQHMDAYGKVLRLAAFNIYAHNRDDHSKNFSFLMDGNGKWRMAPAYDLTFSFSSHGYHSTTVAGEGKQPGKQHLQELAKIFGAKNVEGIIEGIKKVVKNWKHYAQKTGVSSKSDKWITETLRQINN